MLRGAAIAAPAAYAAMTVYDPTVNASTLKIHAEAVQQPEAALKHLEELQKMYATPGRARPVVPNVRAGNTTHTPLPTGMPTALSLCGRPEALPTGALETLPSCHPPRRD